MLGEENDGRMSDKAIDEGALQGSQPQDLFR